MPISGTLEICRFLHMSHSITTTKTFCRIARLALTSTPLVSDIPFLTALPIHGVIGIVMEVFMGTLPLRYQRLSITPLYCDANTLHRFIPAEGYVTRPAVVTGCTGRCAHDYDRSDSVPAL